MKRLIWFCVLAAVLTAAIAPVSGAAEERVYYILCTPGGDVNVRKHARIRSESIGGLVFGKKVLSDGKERYGFIHVIDLAAEDTSGWVSSGYMTEEKPVACEWIGYAAGLGKILARKSMGGKVIKRIDPGSEVIIYAYTDAWCVTEYGFIKTEFLEIPEFAEYAEEIGKGNK